MKFNLRRAGFFAFTIAMVMSALPAFACTTFSLYHGGTALFGRNYDWHIETATVLVNPRGLAKRAFVFDRAAEWVSRYGSVTFNQYGREFPNDGMNEAGLVVAVMWLPETQYEEPDDRPALVAAQWVQYQLDTARTVRDVLASEATLRISPFCGVQLHFLVADAQGGCAAIEFIDGKRVVHTAAEDGAVALSNTTFSKSAVGAAHNLAYRDQAGRTAQRDSLSRFAEAAATARACRLGELKPTVENAFAALKRVEQSDFTKWQIVYDQTRGAIHFRTRSAPNVKKIDLKTLDFSPTDQVLGVSISTERGGDVTDRLAPYRAEENRRQVNQSFDATFFLKPLPSAIRELVIAYPDGIKPVPAKSIPRPGTTRPFAGSVQAGG